MLQGQVPGYPPPTDVPDGHSSHGQLSVCSVGVYISEPTSVISVRCLFSYLIMNTCGIVHFIARVMEFRLKCPE